MIKYQIQCENPTCGYIRRCQSDVILRGIHTTKCPMCKKKTFKHDYDWGDKETVTEKHKKNLEAAAT